MSHTTLQMVLDSKVKLTPMMQQYSSIKENYSDHILLFRMGDFYEVFFEDAVQTSKLLNITLTHRGKVGDFPIPMAGIPHHAAAVYIDRLSNLGLKVAICEQVQDPKEAKGIVQRAVTQVVSPGMPFDLEKTESKDQRFMVSTYQISENEIYFVAIDFTTGEFSGSLLKSTEELINKLLLFAPREMITYMGQWDENDQVTSVLDHLGTLKTYLSDDYFNPKYTEIYLEKLIPGFKRDKTLKDHKTVLKAIGALGYYICSTQNLDTFFHIRPFRLLNEQEEMKVTLATLQGLEILPKSRETYKESLLGYMDKTQSALGSRQLRKFFTAPLFSLEKIEKRQDTIAVLLNDHDFLENLRDSLSEVRDLERILAKVSTNKATPGDLLNTATAIDSYEKILDDLKTKLKGLVTPLKPASLKGLQSLKEDIQSTLNDEVGASLEKGNLIKKGASKNRDRLAKLSQNAAEELSALEQRYRDETGIAKLRVKSNNVAGYFIEVSKSFSSQVPASFNRRQTLVNSERYTTEELTEFEKEITTAKEKLQKLEREIFKELIEKVTSLSHEVQNLADSLGELDSLQSLAWISFQDDFKRPTLLKKGDLKLNRAWHPLIKSILKDQFVPHDLTLDEDCYFGLITGPNMAGKTTVMREVAIIQILAQIGCYVPAQEANLPLCDFLFSRLGASDDILKGQSTFMVEMAETAEIIRHATSKSLVILDEVGRGTSTYDGLSIAWALVEHLIHNTKCKTLFATHYHELIDLIASLPQGKNLTVETKSKDGDVQFLYRLIEEGASQSFGIYVAKLAGLPQSLLHRATEILHNLEVDGNTPQVSSGAQLDFFGAPEPEPEIPAHLRKLEKDLEELDINNLTPLEMMNKVQSLKNELKSSKLH
ncbi:MAG: DNA mismatch repair protein MutS [Bdellovibrionota bacterium]|nr:DNA mismatch repair protein MutS [Bdellovibrionota bacterium]